MNSLRILSSCKTWMRSMCTEAVRAPHVKHKIPQKRASGLMAILQKEGLETLRAGRVYPNFRAGDSIAIEKLAYVSAPKADIIKGVVIGKYNKGMDSSIVILNVDMGTKIERRIPLFSPLVKDIKILKKAFIHKGKKRVRRSKLYYLHKLHPENFTVK